MTKTEFQREERYVVFKVSDLGNSLKGDEIRRLAREYAEQRRLKGKEPLECVVVEKDWPEYEPTWEAIEARVTGAQPAPSIKDAIIDDLQSQFDSEGITEHDSGDALIRLSDAIAAVEDNFAQPAPIEQGTSVRKAWARFSNELHRSPDAPYPGMSEAFEQHFSQSFTDRDWRVESGVWAAAWKAAKRHGAKGE